MNWGLIICVPGSVEILLPWHGGKANLKPFVKLYGGFEVGDSLRSDRDWENNVTVLDGGSSPPGVSVVTIEYAGGCQVDGFTIQNGRSGADGGGIYCSNACAAIANNIISSNHSNNGGGGVYSEDSFVMASHNTISGNFTGAGDVGGGIWCRGGGLVLVQDTISGNHASNGGGLYCQNDDYSLPMSVTMLDSTISGNDAGWGGGGVYLYKASGTIADSTISGNTAYRYGGGMYLYSSSPEIKGNTMGSNTVECSGCGEGVGEGGGMFCSNSDANYNDGTGCNPHITGNKFIDNDGKDHGGGIALEDEGTIPIIDNNLFVRNHVAGTGGGGVQVRDSDSVIINNTFVENCASNTTSTNGNGGAILVRNATANPLIINNIFYDNTARDANAGNSVACRESATASIFYCGAFSHVSGSDSAYHYSLVTPGTGCSVHRIYTGDTPIFVDEANDDYHLRLPGPAYTPIDQGHDPDSSQYDKVPAADFDGHLRVDIPTVTNGSGGYCDMGAFERQP